jgi:hypothetical protein
MTKMTLYLLTLKLKRSKMGMMNKKHIHIREIHKVANPGMTHPTSIVFPCGAQFPNLK